MIERYEELYKDMASAKDVEKMHVFGAVGKWMFCKLAVGCRGERSLRDPCKSGRHDGGKMGQGSVPASCG